MFLVSLSGRKEIVKQQIDAQVADTAAATYLKALVDNAPGTACTLSGSLTSSPDKSHGSLSMSGSFWTPQES